MYLFFICLLPDSMGEKNSGEVPLFNGRAAVYSYDLNKRAWVGLDNGASRVFIFHNVLNDGRRIVALPDSESTYCMNAPIWRNMAPMKPAPYFVQWRDNTNIYGFSFATSDECNSFFDSLERIIKKLVSSTVEQDLTLKNNLSSREMVVKEIFTTEQSYVASLVTLCQKVITPLNTEKKLQSLFTAEEKKSIFQNVETIHDLNKKFLADIEERLHNWNDKQVVGDVFNATMPYFKHYKTYMSNYESAIACLERCQKKREVAQWLKSAEAAAEGQKLPFLLITPVQRIPRYNLLLQELLKKTPEDHADYAHITQALSKIKEIADYVNYSVREQENRTKLLKILEDTKKYVGFEGLLLPHRFLIHEGDVKIPMQDKVQWMLLFNDLLVFATVSVEKGQKEKRVVEETLELDKVWFDDPNENELVLEIIHPKTTITIQLSRKEEKQQWLNFAQKAIADDLRNLKRIVKGDGTPERGIREFEYEFPATKAKYSGEWEVGKPHGQGIFYFPDGASYAGFWVKGKMEGKGKIQYKSGDFYEGDWKNDLPDGYGKLVTGKTVYEGAWARGRKHGHGQIKWPNGDYYDGEWKEDAMEGAGAWVGAEYRYDGEFVNNIFHGKGTLTNMNGVYEGDWIEDLKHGKGKMVYTNGDQYEGDWQNDMRDGVGTFTSQDGNITYDGEWVADRFYGNGKHTIKDVFTYEGNFKDDRREGYGALVLPDGTKYSGNWLDGKKEGSGRLEYPNGAVYDGAWRNDRRHGMGTFTGADGSVYEGSWERDQKEGVGAFLWKDGSKYSGGWKGDRRHGKGVFTTPGETVKYTGEWVNDMRHGKGVQTDITGTYDGDWINDKKHGKGKLTCGNFKYEGSWFNNQLDSNGMLVFEGSDKTPVTYHWANGRMEQPGFRVGPPLLPSLKTRFN